MSDFIALQKDSKVDATDAPGQTFLSLTGEGGTYGDDGINTELCQDREPFEAWWVVSRPPDVATFEETEYAVMRLSGNDDVPVASRNVKVQAAVRTAIATDLQPGDAVLFTGDGTDSVRIHLKPGGDVHIVTSGDVSLDPTGEVLMGGVAATDYVTLFSQLKTLYDAHTHTNPPPLGATGVPVVPLTNAPRATKGRAI